MIIKWLNIVNERLIGKNHSIFSGLGKNIKFTGIIGIILIVTILIVQIGGDVFQTHALTWQTWVIILLITSPVVIVRELYFQLKKRHSIAHEGK